MLISIMKFIDRRNIISCYIIFIIITIVILSPLFLVGTKMTYTLCVIHIISIIVLFNTIYPHAMRDVPDAKAHKPRGVAESLLATGIASIFLLPITALVAWMLAS